MSKAYFLTDEDGNKIYPYGHADAVFTSDGNKVGEKLDDLETHIGNNNIHITSTERTNWNDTNSKKHEHSNKSVLDGITSALITTWNNAVTHISDAVKHITSTERTNWNSAYTHSTSAHAPSNAEANQNAFSNVVVGSTTIAADSKTDSLTLVAGSNVTLTPDATNDKITISATDTKYTHPTSGVTAGTYKNVTVDANGHITAGNNNVTTITQGGTGATDATTARTNLGLGSAATQNHTTSAPSSGSTALISSGAVYTALSEKANSSHGNHVPTVETANNAKFLRNDNTWQTVTPANIGAATTSHTHDDRYYTESEVDTKLQSINPAWLTDGYTKSPFYLNTHPENSPVLLPFMNNDLAYLTKRGGSVKFYVDDIEKTLTGFDTVFDGSPSYWVLNPTGMTTLVFELTLHKVFTWSSTFYIDSGSNQWRAQNLKIEVMNTNYTGDTWVQKGAVTNYGRGHWKVGLNHTPVGATNHGGGFNKIRLTISNFAKTTDFRIAAIGIYNYGSNGLRETFMPRDGGELLGNITPFKTNSYNLGSSDKVFSNVYATNFIGNASKVNGHTVGVDVPSNAKFTDTVYTHPTSSGNKHIPSGGSSGQILRWSADGTAVWGNDNNTTYGVVSTTADGLAPKRDGSTTKFLRADGTWAIPPDNNTVYTHPSYTSKSSGLYKVTVDGTGHVSATTAVAKSDITALGIPAQDTVYTLPTASSTLGGVKTTSTVTSTSGLTACPIISGVPYYKDTVYTHPTTAGNKHIPSGGTSGQVLTWSSSGTATWANPSAGNSSNIQYLPSTDWIQLKNSSGSWVNWKRGGLNYKYLVQQGVVNTSFCGNLEYEANITSNIGGVTKDTYTVSPTITQNGNDLVITASKSAQVGAYGVSVAFVNSIDLTNYNKISAVFNITTTNTNATVHQSSFAIRNTSTLFPYDPVAYCKMMDNTMNFNSGTATIDVSALQGNYEIVFDLTFRPTSTQQTITFKVADVWLE